MHYEYINKKLTLYIHLQKVQLKAAVCLSSELKWFVPEAQQYETDGTIRALSYF